MPKSFKAAFTLVSVLILLLLAGCTKPGSGGMDNPHSKAVYGYFDTVSMIYSYAGDDRATFDANVDAVSSILRDYHKMLDIYNEYEGMNNLCTVNRRAGGEPVAVDPRLIEVLLYAKELCSLTGGEMDVMMGSVLSLWHDARVAEVPALPSDELLKEAALHMGFELLQIDVQNSTLRITDPEASIDVGALGKGYATEMAARYLEEKGISGYVLNTGGNLRCVGTKAGGSGWVTGIRDPRNPESLLLSLEISDCSCVTSGGYERYLEVGGVRYSHLIDKDTLRPAGYFGSVSVITRDSSLADALATALFCMDYEQGRALVDSLDGVQCIWIGLDGSVRCTDELESLITML